MIQSGGWITLEKDCNALLVPSATPIIIPFGTSVQITQAKGGFVTVIVGGNMARIDINNQDDLNALGIDVSELEEEIVQYKHDENKIATGPVEIEKVWDILRTCYDPEIPVNIVDLGLIYECKAIPQENTKNLVDIKMTLTAPGCSMGPVMVQDVERKVLSVENVTSVVVELVFDPPWNQDMMSDAAKLELGFF